MQAFSDSIFPPTVVDYQKHGVEKYKRKIQFVEKKGWNITGR